MERDSFPGRSIGSVGLRDLCPSDCVPGDSDTKKQPFRAVSLMAVRVSYGCDCRCWFGIKIIVRDFLNPSTCGFSFSLAVLGAGFPCDCGGVGSVGSESSPGP